MGNPDPMTYNEPTATPHRLTDEQAGYDVPSEAALAFVFEHTQPSQRYVIPQTSDSGTLYAVVPCGEKSAEFYTPYLARLLDQFAAQAVAAREAEIVALTKERDELKANKERLWDNARELGEVLDDVAKGIKKGELDREYWQGKKDGLRLSIALLHPDKDLEGVWIGSLQTSHHAMFLEVEEKVMDRAKQTRRERLSESMRKYREQQASK